MASIRTIRIGASTITSQAPERNFVLATMTTITAVVAAPSPLISRPACQPFSRRLHQRTTIPDWDSVKATKTPSV